MDITFWGVRGTRPITENNVQKYGGNTPCVEINTNGYTIILDAGTGIVNLGKKLVQQNINNIHIFITHTHWDHIQGLPFFKPFFEPNNKIFLYGCDQSNMSFENILKHQIDEEHFPVQWDDYESTQEFTALKHNSTIKIDNNTSIETIEAIHTCRCMNFKILSNNHSIGYITDNEWVLDKNNNLIDFIRDCDVLILDTFFTDEEYFTSSITSKKGWGHGTWQQGVKLAKDANIKKLVLFHHNENKTDCLLDNLKIKAQKIFKETTIAKEGMVISI